MPVAERSSRLVQGVIAAALVVSVAALNWTVARGRGRQPDAPVVTSVEPAPIARGRAPATGEYSTQFDALHYDIHVSVPASGNVIEGHTIIQIGVGAGAPATLPLDFTGLSVTRVQVNQSVSPFTYENGKLLIPIGTQTTARTVTVAIDYRGTPDDGLQIRNNVHGRRAAFVDNWPNRARFWFPSIDYPADKATASFEVSVPAQWQVVANGVPNGEPLRDGEGRRVFRWTIAQPVSTYNMVFGAAEFRVQRVGRPCLNDGRCIEVTTWLFPQSAARAARSFRRAGDIVKYFSELIAPFPYAKLAHVQSSTEFGGMENATAIFYSERAVASGRDIEDTVAHETAHQWFGDSVTEADWRDLWLSEGFATYFAALFVEHADGQEPFRRVMEAERETILKSKVVDRPIVDGDEHDLFKRLNPNNYQKGGWVLHMLRGIVGDAAFFDGIRRYYRGHEHGTAVTADLQRAMEEASGVELDTFFDQWVFKPGYPRFRVTWRWDANRQVVSGAVEQTQPAGWPTYRLPLTIEVAGGSASRRQAIQMNGRRELFSIPLASRPARVVLDPDGWVLKDVEPPVR